MAVTQWNCRGTYNNPEIQILIQQLNPSILCLQETYYNPNRPQILRGFSIFNQNTAATPGGKTTGGVAIAIKPGIPHSEVPLNTNLQAQAVRITLHRTFTLCNIYIPPPSKPTPQDFDDLINQLPQPFLLVGDFNAHSTQWGNRNTDPKGRLIENLIIRHNLCMLNDNSPTYLHLPTGSKTAIDLSITSANLYLDLDWSVEADLFGSDHYPITIKPTVQYQEDKPARFNYNKTT